MVRVTVRCVSLSSSESAGWQSAMLERGCKPNRQNCMVPVSGSRLGVGRAAAREDVKGYGGERSDSKHSLGSEAAVK